MWKSFLQVFSLSCSSELGQDQLVQLLTCIGGIASLELVRPKCRKCRKAQPSHKKMQKSPSGLLPPASTHHISRSSQERLFCILWGRVALFCIFYILGSSHWEEDCWEEMGRH